MLKLLFFFAILSLTLGQPYDDYSMVRFYGINDNDVTSFFEASLDVWAANKNESWADVMIHKDLLKQYLDRYPQYKIVYDNVQTELDRSFEENEKAKAAAVGSPFAFDYFPPYPDVVQWLQDLQNTYPNWASRVDIGASYEGRRIYALHVSNAAATAPAIFIHCTIHAREWITTTTCAYIIQQLLTKDTNFLQYFNWVFIPVLNVDGYTYTHSSSSNRLWRKNRQPNTGSTCVGTDLNRNYGTGWGGPGADTNPCGETYRGTAGFSGTELRVERVYFNTWDNVAAFVDIHAYGGMWMSPWGYTYSYPPTTDWNRMNAIMVQSVNAVRSVNGRSYSYGSVANTIYQASGGSNDWSYGEGGVIPSYAIECSGTSFTAPVSQIVPVGSEIYAGIIAMARMIQQK
jgi:murein tripeptide amidase MpaA